MKLKIGTHDSATGEQGKGFISWLVTPFAKTLSKTIKEQYNAGCRLFDIRIKLIDNVWRCAHGCWNTKRTAEDILKEINSFPETCHICLTYEGHSEHKLELIRFIGQIKSKFTNLLFGPVSIKYSDDCKGVKVKYSTILLADPNWIDGRCIQGFKPLDGRSWHTYLPIPWLWKKIYYNKPKFNEQDYTWVDFL